MKRPLAQRVPPLLWDFPPFVSSSAQTDCGGVVRPSASSHSYLFKATFLSHGKQGVRDVNPILSRRNLQRETWVGQMQRGSRILFKIPGEYNSFSSSPPRQHAIVKRVAKRERLAVEHRHRRFAVQKIFRGEAESAFVPSYSSSFFSFQFAQQPVLASETALHRCGLGAK